MADPRIPQTQDKEWLRLADWLKRHEQLLARRDGLRDTQVVFLGDSITEGWLGSGKAAWDKHFAPYRPLNLGIGGDETQHILWRIGRGTLDGISPRVLVLLIGTNNIGNSDSSGVESAEGVKLVLETIRAKLPKTRILLLAVFPRDEKPGTPFRKEVDALNAIIRKAAEGDGGMIQYVDFSGLFLQPDGTLPKEMCPDFLHLSAEAYEKLGAAIAQRLRMM